MLFAFEFQYIRFNCASPLTVPPPFPVDPHASEWEVKDWTLLPACVSGKAPAVLLCPLPRRKTLRFLLHGARLSLVKSESLVDVNLADLYLIIQNIFFVHLSRLHLSCLSSCTSGSPFLHFAFMPGRTAGDEVGGQPSWCVQRGGGDGFCHPHTGSSPLRCLYRLFVQHKSPFTVKLGQQFADSSFRRMNFPSICLFSCLYIVLPFCRVSIKRFALYLPV